MSDVCVIGSFVMDTCVLVDEFPLPGQTVIARKVRYSAGGKGCNQCVAAARLHADCEMIGMLGSDEAGKTFLELLQKEGIRHEHVTMCSHAPTGFSQIQMDASAENKIVVVPGANYCMPSDIVEEIANRILISRLVVLQMELPMETLSAILSFCKENKKPVLLNPAPAKPLSSELLNGIDYLTPNETELAILTGMPCREKDEVRSAIQLLQKKGVKHIVATLGERGCAIGNENGIRFLSGYPVTVVDTVAAGDAFNGALAKGIVDALPLCEGVKLANAAGALAVTRPGAIPSLPTMEEVKQFLVHQEEEVA